MSEARGEVLAGQVERVVFHNPDSGFCVLRVKARGHRDLVAVVGNTPNPGAGEWITATGEWETDSRHGQQFRAGFMRFAEPSTTDGILRYLGSGMIPGIGPVYARKLVKAFGERVFDIIESEPRRLRDVPGIGEVRTRRIIAAWKEQKAIREIMVFLHQHGVGTGRATRIYRTYGADAVRVLSQDPYRLIRDIRGIGFRVADGIAHRLGIEKHAMVRIRAGVMHVLQEATGQGHCGLPEHELLEKACSLLEVPDTLARQALDHEVADGHLVADEVGETACLFQAGLYRAELAIARRLLETAAGSPPWPVIDADRALPWVSERIGLELAPGQADAVRRALTSKVMVMTGGPGVGKTTIVTAIQRILMAKGVGIELCAPTGRAAKRLSEATGRPARTIHRLLAFDPVTGGFRHNADNRLECDLLIVDETSMVDVGLMNALLAALPDRSALLLVGDVDQLPSVGPGQVLSDIIASGAVPVVRLLEVFRQAARSRIIASAHDINRGVVPDLSKPDGESDFYFFPADDPERAHDRIVELVRRRIPDRFGFDPVRDIQVLCPMTRSVVGTRALNLALQEVLNPDRSRSISRFGWTFAPGDRVMQIENDYNRDVYNGDIGQVGDVDDEAGELTVSFDGSLVTYTSGDLDALVPAYATTIHKSQGSEFPVVVIPVMTQHYHMLRRNLLYTGVTRGKSLAVLVGQRQAVGIAVNASGGERRWSRLGEWLGRAGVRSADA